jgi:hypothetical protein
MSSLSYDVAKLLKEPENRLCADCSTALGSPANISASLRYGVWLCNVCAEIHLSQLFCPPKLVKRATDKWHPSEISIMLTAKSNLHQNHIFEKYIPTGWEKITSSSSPSEKFSWIKAKYYSHYFTLPQISSFDGKLDKKKMDKDRKKRIIEDSTLPTRIVDYFLILGPDKAVLKKDHNKGPEAGDEISPLQRIEQGGLENLEFKVDIIDSYPAKNFYIDTPIPELVGPMIFSSGLHLSKTEKAPYSFSFVLTDINRVKLYGVTLIVYEIIDPELLLSLLNSSSSGKPLSPT